MLLYFFAFYFFQSLCLLISNIKLKRLNCFITKIAEENKKGLAQQVAKNDKLYRGSVVVQELVDEYFTHYSHELLTRDVFIEEIFLKDVLRQAEDYCSNQIIKQDVKLTLEINTGDTIQVKTDKGILFVILLNHIYRAVLRANTTSEIKAIISQIKNKIYIDINDIGYEYIPRLNIGYNKIRLCELSNLILDDLCQKLGVEINENRYDDKNTTSIVIMKEPEEEPSNCKIINFKPYVSRN